MKKKVLAMAAAFALLCTPCLADDLDYASMSDEELHAVVDGARNELASRELTMAGDTVLFDQDGFKVYLTGNNEISEYSPFLRLEAIAINDTDKTVDFRISEASVNGWDVYCGGIEVNAGKKKKDGLGIDLSSTDVKTMEDIEEIELKMYLYDSDAYERLTDEITITLHPVAE